MTSFDHLKRTLCPFWCPSRVGRGNVGVDLPFQWKLNTAVKQKPQRQLCCLVEILTAQSTLKLVRGDKCIPRERIKLQFHNISVQIRPRRQCDVIWWANQHSWCQPRHKINRQATTWGQWPRHEVAKQHATCTSIDTQPMHAHITSPLFKTCVHVHVHTCLHRLNYMYMYVQVRRNWFNSCCSDVKYPHIV